MKLEKHKKIEFKENNEFKFTSIQELARQYVSNFILACEETYGKDPMTEGTIPCAELAKAAIEEYIESNAPFLQNKKNYKEDFESLLKDAEILEKEFNEKSKN